MATTKAFELAQLSALTTVGADTSLADSLNLNAATHSFQISGTPVLSYSGGNVIVGDLGAGVGLEFSGSTHLVTDTQGVNITGELDVSGILDVADTTTSTSTSTGALVVAGGAGIAENLNVGGNAGVTGNLTVTGDLTVEGSQVSLNTTALDVEDKNITLNYHASNDTSASADGAGITIQDAVDATTNATMLWDATDDQFDFSHGVNVTGNSNISGNLDIAASTTETRSLQIGHGRTSDGISLIDLVGDATYSDYGFRIQRAGTSSGKSSLLHKGTGNLEIRAIDASAIRFKTTDADRMFIMSGGDITFYEDNSGSPQVGMHWDYADGRLGIGTTTPDSLLDVKIAEDTLANVLANEIYAATFLSTTSGNTGHTTAIMLSGSSGTNRGVAIAAEAQSTGNDHDMIFATSASGSTPTEHVRITSDGKVGIGTDDPAEAFVIKGDGHRMTVESTDYENIMIGRRSSSGAGLDQGYIRMKSAGNNTVVIDTAGDSYFNGGDVGIGTDNPDCALDVTRTTGWAEMHLDGASGGDLILKDNGVSYGEIYAGNGHGLVVKAYATQDIYFLTNAEATAKMVIESGGNVGIGADPAVHKLDVDGAIATRQVRHNIRPALNLDFANSKQLDSRITFYRDSIATYYDKKGMLKYASENEPRFDHDPYTGESKGLFIEEARTNTKIYSEHLPTTMGTEFGASWVPNYAVAPNGKMQAAALYGDGTSSARAVQSYTGANTYTMSIYAKNNASNNTGRFGIWAYSGGWVYSVTFTWDGDTVTHNAPAGSTRVEKIGNGWVRVYCTWTTSGNGSFQVSPGAYANYNSGDSTLFWGMNFEAGKAYSGSYIPSDTRFVSRASEATYYDETGIIRTAPANSPRYGYKYDGRKWVETGLILENASTNHVGRTTNKFADPFSDGNYQIAPVDSTGETLAPDGSYTASKMVPTTGSSFNYSSHYSESSAFTNGVIQVNSVYAKAGTTEFLWMSMPSTGEPNASFNLSTGEVTNISSGLFDAGMEYAGNGWWRCYIMGVVAGSPSTSAVTFSIADNGTGGRASADYLYLWGKQIETNELTSHIVNNASTGTITRSADVASSVAYTRARDYAESYKVDDLMPDVNQSNIDFTLYGDLQGIAHNAGFQQAIYLEDSSDSGNMYAHLFSAYNSNNTISTAYNINGVARNFGNWTSTASDIALRWKIAMGIEENNSRAAANGVLGSSAAGYWNGGGTFDRFYIGSGYQGGRAFNGWIRKIVYYDKRLSNDEMVALTENN